MRRSPASVARPWSWATTVWWPISTRKRRTPSPSMLVSRAMLERHLDWVARRFQIVSLDELRSRLETRAPARDRPIAAITFDDGYRDVYEQAFPLLMRKGIPATVFVATDYVGTAGVFPHDTLYLLLERASHRWRSFSRQLLDLLRGLELPLPEPAVLSGRDFAVRRAAEHCSPSSRGRCAAHHQGPRSGLRFVRRGARGFPDHDVGHARRDEPRRNRRGLTHQASLLADQRGPVDGCRGDAGLARGAGREPGPARHVLCVSGRQLRCDRRCGRRRRWIPDRRHDVPASRRESSMAHRSPTAAVGALERRCSRPVLSRNPQLSDQRHLRQVLSLSEAPCAR